MHNSSSASDNKCVPKIPYIYLQFVNFDTIHNTPKIFSVHTHLLSKFDKKYGIKEYMILYCTKYG